jgi:hypothetical protein
MLGFQILLEEHGEDCHDPEHLDFTSGTFMSDKAARPLEDKQDYAGRGRAYNNLSDDQLQYVFIHIFHELAHSSSFETILTGLHDVEAEYRLRQLDPPYALVKNDAEDFIKRVSDAVNSFDCGRR